MAIDIDSLIETAVFGSGSQLSQSRRQIRAAAAGAGITPASIQGLYDAASKGLYSHRTVPAINIRGITYQVARAVFRAALKQRAGAFIFEIARSEIGYTAQRPDEYAVCILAAAIKEGFRGQVFIQGDHFQVNRSRYAADPQKEMGAIRELIKEAVSAGFLNIDIDASTLVDLGRGSLEEQQTENCRITAEMTKFIRGIQPEGTIISVGGEIGEVGKQNSTVADLKAFMSGYRKRLGKDMNGISKISVQTGTSHGGVVLPDGSIAKVKVDFKTLEELSELARRDYGMAGAVQHGASTLPDEAFGMFPQVGTAEVHLATGFQNLIYDSPHFPRELTERIRQHLLQNSAGLRQPDETDEQFIYKNRKRSFGDFKREMWSLPEASLKALGDMLEERFALLFHRLKVADTVDLVKKFVP